MFTSQYKKICSECGEEKFLAFFYKIRGKINNQCSSCKIKKINECRIKYRGRSDAHMNKKRQKEHILINTYTNDCFGF